MSALTPEHWGLLFTNLLIGLAISFERYEAWRAHRARKIVVEKVEIVSAKQDVLHETVNGGLREAVNVAADALEHVANLVIEPIAKASAARAAAVARKKANTLNEAAQKQNEREGVVDHSLFTTQPIQ